MFFKCPFQVTEVLILDVQILNCNIICRHLVTTRDLESWDKKLLFIVNETSFCSSMLSSTDTKRRKLRSFSFTPIELQIGESPHTANYTVLIYCMWIHQFPSGSVDWPFQKSQWHYFMQHNLDPHAVLLKDTIARWLKNCFFYLVSTVYIQYCDLENTFRVTYKIIKFSPQFHSYLYFITTLQMFWVFDISTMSITTLLEGILYIIIYNMIWKRGGTVV